VIVFICTTFTSQTLSGLTKECSSNLKYVDNTACNHIHTMISIITALPYFPFSVHGLHHINSVVLTEIS